MQIFLFHPNLDLVALTRRASIGLGSLKYAVQVHVAAEDKFSIY